MLRCHSYEPDYKEPLLILLSAPSLILLLLIRERRFRRRAHAAYASPLLDITLLILLSHSFEDALLYDIADYLLLRYAP